MKKVAITGSNGFVGSRLTSYLLHKGYQVDCLVRETSNLDLLPKDAPIVTVDYNDRKNLKHKLDGCNVLIHNAALTRANNWEEFKLTNVLLTEDLVRIGNELPTIEQFIFISSQSAAGPAKDLSSPLKENDQAQPLSHYGKSKLEAEKRIIERSLKPYTIIRPTSVFGPGDKDFLLYFKLVKKHISIRIGKYPQYYNLIYVDDLIKLISLTILQKKAYNEIFFAGYKEPLSQKTFTGLLEQVTNSFTNPIKIPNCALNLIGKIADIYSRIRKKAALLSSQKVLDLSQTYWLVDTSKAENILDFKPGFDILEALHITFNWYKDHNWL